MLTLKRQAVDLEGLNSGPEKTWREHVESELGYRVPRQPESERALRKAMVDLGIRPFRPSTVEWYKRRKIGLFPAPFLFVAAVFLCVFGVIVFGIVIAGMKEDGISGWWLLLPSATLALGIWAGITDLQQGSYSRLWASDSLPEYRQPVPEFVLQSALDIKARCPQAEFFVEQLLVESRPRDPFLVVYVPESVTRYYIEVWNEPSFKQRRVL